MKSLFKLLKKETLEDVSGQTLTKGSSTAPTTTSPNATAVTGYGNAPYEMATYVPGDFTDVKLINLEAFLLSRYNAPTFLRTITAAATTGAQTINKPAGTVNFAAWASSLVVTNSLVTANSIVLCTIRAADSSFTFIKSVVCAAGSFTITANAAANAETSVWFVVFN